MLHISDRAIAEIQRIRSKQIPANSHFRLAVVDSGCAGMSYDMGFDDQIRSNDQQLQFHDLSVVVDATSAEHLRELEIDYTEDLMGGGFQFSNPQARQTCGCGISFSISVDNTNEWAVDCGL